VPLVVTKKCGFGSTLLVGALCHGTQDYGLQPPLLTVGVINLELGGGGIVLLLLSKNISALLGDYQNFIFLIRRESAFSASPALVG
jgi:hypothetical protein